MNNMNSLILSIILFISMNVWSACEDFSKNSNECLHDTTLNWPTYSNGDNFKIGDGVCRSYNNGEYQEFISSTKQGINISLQFPQKVCRNILNIESITKPIYVHDGPGNPSCCSENRPSYWTYEECLKGNYWKCQDSILLNHKATVGYYTSYNDKTIIIPDASKNPKRIIKQSSNAFLIGDTIELYRNDGSLRYKGFVNVIDTLVITKGQCYNKLGTKPIKKTNNADFCK